MSDWGRGRGSRRWVIVAGVVAVLVLVVVIWTKSRPFVAGVGETSTPVVSPSVSVSQLPVRGEVLVDTYDGWPSGAEGMPLPRPGVGNGPSAVTEAGIPVGYTQDSAGAALAAGNAVVAGLWWAPTVVDPWSKLAVLAAESDAAVGPLPAGLSVTEFLSGPGETIVAGEIGGAAPSNVEVAASAYGMRLLGVTGTVSEDGRSASMRVMALVMGDVPLQGTGVWLVDAPVGLVWQGGDWKVQSVGTNWSQVSNSILPVKGLPQEGWLA